jgi:gas vesicle protein
MEKTIGFVGGFVVGAMIGAAVAVFMAPQSGEEFQKQIRERLDAVAQEGRRAAAERRAELEAQFAQAKQFQKSSASPMQ